MILVRITFENELGALEWHGAYNSDFRSRPD